MVIIKNPKLQNRDFELITVLCYRVSESQGSTTVNGSFRISISNFYFESRFKRVMGVPSYRFSQTGRFLMETIEHKCLADVVEIS